VLSERTSGSLVKQEKRGATYWRNASLLRRRFFSSANPESRMQERPMQKSPWARNSELETHGSSCPSKILTSPREQCSSLDYVLGVGG